MSSPADVLWWIFLTSVLGVGVLVGALGVAMVIAQRRLIALHRGFAQRLLAAQEEERARVAREVHDDAVQRLAAVRFELKGLEATVSLDPGERHRMRGIGGDVEDLAMSLRRLAHGLHPATMKQAGLIGALTQLADEMSRTGLTVRLTLPPSAPSLTPERALVLFRIAQEGLNNVARHAEVREATLTLREDGADVALQLEDRGRGFDVGAGRRGRGLGLIGMDERAQLAGGHATIHSRPHQGTTITVRVPKGPSSP